MSARIVYVITAGALLCAVGSAAAQGSAPSSSQKPAGPVQGYQGGYDPTDKSKAPATKGGAPTDAANPDEGGPTREVAGRIASVDNAAMTITLEGGRAFTLPPTVKLEPDELRPGTPVRVRYQRRGDADLVTSVLVVTGAPR